MSIRPRLDPKTAEALSRVAVHLTVQAGRPVSESEALKRLVRAADPQEPPTARAAHR